MNNETLVTDTNVNNGVEEKTTENFSPIVEVGDKSLQPKTAPKWGGWKQSLFNGIDKIYETLDPGFKAENKNQDQEVTSINQNIQKQREFQNEMNIEDINSNGNNDTFNLGAFGKKALNAISDILAPPISRGTTSTIDNAEVLFDFNNPSYHQQFVDEGGEEIKNTMNNYIKYAKDRLMKFKYPELVQSKFQAMDALFDKIEINTILKSNDAISSILTDEAITTKYKSYLEGFNMESDILEKLQEIIKPVLTMSKDKYSSFQKEFSIVLIDIKENNGDPERLNKSITEALDSIQFSEASAIAKYSVAACEQFLKIAEVILLYIKEIRLKQNDYNEGKIKEPPTDIYNTITFAKNICSICIILLRECKFIAFEYLNSYYLIFQYIKNFNIIQKENPVKDRMATPRIDEITERIKYNKNIIMKCLESALVDIHGVFMGNLQLLQLLTTYQTNTQKVELEQPKEQQTMNIHSS